MVKKERIPIDILEGLDIKTKTKIEPILVKAVVEHHQARLTIPKQIRLNMNLKAGQEFEVIYDKNKREIIFKLK